MTSDFRPQVEMWPFHACTMHPAIIIGTVRSFWNRLWGRYHVPQNVFLVRDSFIGPMMFLVHINDLDCLWCYDQIVL